MGVSIEGKSYSLDLSFNQFSKTNRNIFRTATITSNPTTRRQSCETDQNHNHIIIIR